MEIIIIYVKNNNILVNIRNLCKDYKRLLLLIGPKCVGQT